MPTSTISAIDLINFSQSIAQLNLGYLGISVAILGVLGGVFVYFNLKPIKDTLDKQEKVLDDLKAEVVGLLKESETQTEKVLTDFKKTQSSLLDSTLQQQKKDIELDIKNKLQESERLLLEKIESISDSKDTKLKELISSETVNRVATLDKNLTAAINLSKEEFNKITSPIEKAISGLKSEIRNLQRDVKELKVYKYSKENQMGAIIYSIELLKEDIDEKRWSILNSLERLKGEIEGRVLDTEYVAKIEEQLARIQDNPKYNVIISQIRKEYAEEKKT